MLVNSTRPICGIAEINRFAWCKCNNPPLASHTAGPMVSTDFFTMMTQRKQYI